MFNAQSVVFGGSELDRAAHLRDDPAALAAMVDDPAARSLVLWRGKLLLQGEGLGLARLKLGHPVMADAGAPRVFLGLDDAGPVFCVDLTKWSSDPDDNPQMGTFLDPTLQHHPATGDMMCFAELRSVMAELSARDAELAATARSVLGWHQTHQFCSHCGVKSDPVQAGWMRECPACGARHFPRTDPVVIMLVTSGDSVLVGRSHGWPEGMYSLLAGFVEPGETIEAAVRREVFEEAGIAVGEVSYLASQPWAFPSSLMIGCLGRATSNDISLDPVELEDAIWVSRSEMQQVADGLHPTMKPSRKGAIAHFLIENWLANRIG